MSTFVEKFRHRKSGVDVDVLCIDGYFGGRNYGYKFPDGRVLNQEEMFREYKQITQMDVNHE